MANGQQKFRASKSPIPRTLRTPMLNLNDCGRLIASSNAWSGAMVGEWTSHTDPGGNWMMQFYAAKGHEFYRVTFEPVYAGAADVDGYLGPNPSDNSYQSMDPMTVYDRPLSVEGAMKTSKEALESSVHEHANPFCIGSWNS